MINRRKVLLIFDDYPDGDVEVFVSAVRQYGGVRVGGEHWDCSIELPDSEPPTESSVI